MFAEKLQAIRSDDEAVSPVIGVILMVAVTVVLAAVIGAFVFGMGDSLNQPAPDAQIEFDYNSNSNNNLLIKHDGGQTINADNAGVLAVTGVDTADADEGDWGASVDGSQGDDATEGVVDGSISAGSTIWDSSQGTNSGYFSSGDTVELVWNAPDGGNSQVIGTWTAP